MTINTNNQTLMKINFQSWTYFKPTQNSLEYLQGVQRSWKENKSFVNILQMKEIISMLQLSSPKHSNMRCSP
jgi:hypothetical protein